MCIIDPDAVASRGPKFKPLKVRKDPPVPGELTGSATVTTGASYVKPFGLVPTSSATVTNVAGLPTPIARAHPTVELEVQIVVTQRDRPSWAVRVKSAAAKFEPMIGKNDCKSRIFIHSSISVPPHAAAAFCADQAVRTAASNVKSMADVPTSISVVSVEDREMVRYESADAHRNTVFADHADVWQGESASCAVEVRSIIPKLTPVRVRYDPEDTGMLMGVKSVIAGAS